MNAVKEQITQNKENQHVLAQASMDANEKIDLLEKHCAALMAKQPPPAPLQDTAADQLQQIKVLTDKINKLESNSGGNNGGVRNGGRGGYRSLGSNSFPKNNGNGTRGHAEDGTMTTTVCWTCGYDMQVTLHQGCALKYLMREF